MAVPTATEGPGEVLTVHDTDLVLDGRNGPPPDAPPRALRWPRRTLPAPPTALYPWPPGQSLAPPGGRPEDTPDLGVVQVFQMPTARLLRLGDVMGQYVGHLGWVGLRYGLSRRIDVGLGVPYYLLGLSVDVRVAFVQSSRFAAAWWGYASVPFVPSADRPTAYLGFTWSYAGLGWATGPLLTWWSTRLSVSVGLHLAQRTGLGGAWFLGHLSADVRILDGVKLLAQAVVLTEVSPEAHDRAAPLLHEGGLRTLPYALGGMRLYTRRFFADLGVLVPLSPAAPLWSDRIAALPWITLSHLF